MGALYAPTDRWIFCPDQRPDEAWLLKSYDTRENVAKCCFHNSFHDPFYDGAPEEVPGRRSCEVFLLLTFPKEMAARKGNQKNVSSSRL